jgi:hypothetical protein
MRLCEACSPSSEDSSHMRRDRKYSARDMRKFVLGQFDITFLGGLGEIVGGGNGCVFLARISLVGADGCRSLIKC